MKPDAELLCSIEQFLYLEATLADSHRYDDWLALWEDELLYWVPVNADAVDPAKHISLIYEGRAQLLERIERMKGKHAHAQNPRSRLGRVISNVRIREISDAELIAESAFVLGEIRPNSETFWMGRYLHTLTRAAGSFRIRQKKVFLLNNNSTMKNLQFLV